MARKRSLGNKLKRRAAGGSSKWTPFMESIKNICEYCDGKVLDSSDLRNTSARDRRTFDHIVCQAIGGKTTPENLIVCCATCNEAKAEFDFFEFSLFAEFYLKPLRKMGWKENGFHQHAMELRNKFFGLRAKDNRPRSEKRMEFVQQQKAFKAQKKEEKRITNG